MIVGLLVISFLLSVAAAVIAKLLGATMLGAMAVYVGTGTLLGLGMGVCLILRALRSER